MIPTSALLRRWTPNLRAQPAVGTAAAPARAAQEADGALWLLLAILGASQLVFLLRMSASPLLALGAAAALLIGVALAVPPTSRRIRLGAGAVIACLGVAAVLCVLGGQGHLLYANDDWKVRDAVLADLSRGTWPLTYGEGGHALVLRAPIGLYCLPSLVGRCFGLVAAHLTLLAEGMLLLGAVLLTFTAGQGAAVRGVTLAVFVGFSGLDLIGGLFLPVHLAAGQIPLMGIAPEFWARGLQYSALLTDLFWAPNHALPAWIMVAGYVCWRRRMCSAALLAALSALCLLWSPLACMGAAPFVALPLAVDVRDGRLSPREAAGLCCLAAAVLPGAIYMTIDSGSVLHAWNFTTTEFQKYYGVFLLLEVAPLVYLASRAPSLRTGCGALEFGVIVALLLAIPLYKIGFSNDFMMRASIFPISLAALLAAEGLVEDARARARGWLGLSVTLLALGAATPAMQAAIALSLPPQAPSAADLPHAWAASPFKGQEITPYVVRLDSYRRWSWLLKPAALTSK